MLSNGVHASSSSRPDWSTKTYANGMSRGILRGNPFLPSDNVVDRRPVFIVPRRSYATARANAAMSTTTPSVAWDLGPPAAGVDVE